jgi:hypothetical protein
MAQRNSARRAPVIEHIPGRSSMSRPSVRLPLRSAAPSRTLLRGPLCQLEEADAIAVATALTPASIIDTARTKMGNRPAMFPFPQKQPSSCRVVDRALS